MGVGVPNFTATSGNERMRSPGISRRDMLRGSAALAAGAAFSTRVVAAAPLAEPVTPALIAFG